MPMSIHRAVLFAAACFGIFSSMDVAGATPIQDTSSTVFIKPGQSLNEAVADQKWQARIARLRVDWAAKHPSNAATTNDSTAPQILGGTVLSPTLTVGDVHSVPSIQFTYSTGSGGFCCANFSFTSPSGAQTIQVPFEQGPYATSGTVTFTYPYSLPFYSQPGTWTLSAVSLSDYAGNYVSYSGSQLTGLFATSSFTLVNNGPADYTPPVASTGSVLTPTVSIAAPAPQFSATLTASDDLSGMLEVYVAITPPGGFFGQIELSTLAAPLKSGTFTAYSPLYSGQPTGSWTISSIGLCDVAGNCTFDSSATDIQNLFGTTTITVTP